MLCLVFIKLIDLKITYLIGKLASFNPQNFLQLANPSMGFEAAFTSNRLAKKLGIVCINKKSLKKYTFCPCQVFGGIKLNQDTAINRHNNFQTFPAAALVLFR